MLFYQRAGQNKDAAHAGMGWTDGRSFVGPLQDHHCRVYSDPNNAATERDVWGGWYDAGDPNKYTSWTAGYVESLLRAYAENPTIWSDDYNIPSRETAFPTYWTRQMGSRLPGAPAGFGRLVLSIVGEPAASPHRPPPGVALRAGQHLGDADGGGGVCRGGRILRLPGIAALNTAADGYLTRAKNAWTWAAANPAVIFKNNDSASGSSGLGSGQQETDDYGRLVDKLDAAGQLFAATGDATYPPSSTPTTASCTSSRTATTSRPGTCRGRTRRSTTRTRRAPPPPRSRPSAPTTWPGAESSGNLGAVTGNQDPYLAYMSQYTWGSNSVKANTGDFLADVVVHKLDASNADIMRAASRFVHYLHGTNPLSLVYLTNMSGSRGREQRALRSFTPGSPTAARSGIGLASRPTARLRGTSPVVPIPATTGMVAAPPAAAAPPTTRSAWQNQSPRPRGNRRRSPTRTSTRAGRSIPGASPSRATATRSPTSGCSRSSCASPARAHHRTSCGTTGVPRRVDTRRPPAPFKREVPFRQVGPPASLNIR